MSEKQKKYGQESCICSILYVQEQTFDRSIYIIEKGRENYIMNKNKVIKEMCLLMAIVLTGCLLISQTVFAAETSDTAQNTIIMAEDTEQPVLQNPDSIPSGSEQTADRSPETDHSNDRGDESTGSDLQLPDPSPVLLTDSVHLVAGGDTYELQLKNAVNASYEIISDTAASGITSQSESAVRLMNATAQSVTVIPLKAGEAVISVTATANDQSVSVLTCRITVSELSVEEKQIELYMNDENHSAMITVSGADPDAVYYGSGNEWEESFRDALADSMYCSVHSNNDQIAKAYFDQGSVCIEGVSRGTTNIKINLYGVPFSVKVKVFHYTLNKYTINTYIGSADKTLKIKGNGKHKVTWVSGNAKVATVSRKGVVSVKGIGATKITAKVNGRKVVCIVSVSSRTAYRVVKNARDISKIKNIQYSQAQRMSKNFYDCSSLVYRCYRVYGIRFGYRHPSWAPTAADEGRWCASTKHLVASEAVDILSCKMVPGDTIYYSFNGNNGRYLNIDHTAIFAGYEYDEKNGYYGTVIEASSSSNGVVERMYYAGSSIQLIGRPCKK